MPAVAAAKRRKPALGAARPRIGPPLPLRSDLASFKAVAERVEFELYPWQLTDARYLQARGPFGWQWREVATIVARQNGKTSVLELLVLVRMLMGHAVMHSAQNRALPRQSHDHLADLITRFYPDELKRVRYAAGQEEIALKGGGVYRIVAPTRGGARGKSNDLVVLDEVLDLEDLDFLAAAKPTVQASANAQIAYFSNAGTPESVVLNSLKSRADNDPDLAYLEWSAPPDAAPDDIRGWLQANPAVGHNPAHLRNLESEYRAHTLGDTAEVWEREYLCRWSNSIGRPPLVLPEEWERQDFSGIMPTGLCILGIKMDPGGKRASAVAAWSTDNGVALQVVADVTGDPIDVEQLGPELYRMAVKLRTIEVAFDPVTDADLARYFRRTKSITQRDYAAASEKFVRLTLGRQMTVSDPAQLLARDLEATVRSANVSGMYYAVKSAPELSNTTVEAAIRAAWSASAPRPKVAVH